MHVWLHNIYVCVWTIFCRITSYFLKWVYLSKISICSPTYVHCYVSRKVLTDYIIKLLCITACYFCHFGWFPTHCCVCLTNFYGNCTSFLHAIFTIGGLEINTKLQRYCMISHNYVWHNINRGYVVNYNKACKHKSPFVCLLLQFVWLCLDSWMNERFLIFGRSITALYILANPNKYQLQR